MTALERRRREVDCVLSSIVALSSLVLIQEIDYMWPTRERKYRQLEAVPRVRERRSCAVHINAKMDGALVHTDADVGLHLEHYRLRRGSLPHSPTQSRYGQMEWAVHRHIPKPK